MRLYLVVLAGLLVFCMAYAQDDEKPERDKSNMPRRYFAVECGGAFTLEGDIKVNQDFWFPALEGYNGTLGRAFMVGAGLGLIPCDWVTFEVAANYRGPFRYCKPQVAVAQDILFVDLARLFDVANTSFMVNTFLNRAGRWSWLLDQDYDADFSVAPYFGMGVGLAHTTIYNFHTVLVDKEKIGFNSFNKVSGFMTETSDVTLAWQVALGLDLCFWESVSIGIGYRYFDGGRIKTNDYFIDPPFGAVPPVPSEVPAWTTRFRTNEIVLTAVVVY